MADGVVGDLRSSTIRLAADGNVAMSHRESSRVRLRSDGESDFLVFVLRLRKERIVHRLAQMDMIGQAVAFTIGDRLNRVSKQTPSKTTIDS